MPEQIKDIIGDYEAFIRDVDAGIERIGIHRSEIAMIDHICYRVETNERYEEMLNRFTGIGRMIGESQVNGRPIATFEFDDYLSVAGWIIPYLELPAPKPGSEYKEGLEHAELVVVGSLDNFAQRHKDLVFKEAGMEKSINPELGFKQDGLSVKFHEQQLGAVVRIEAQLGIVKVDQS